jgi:predicted nucleic acid-binding protein
MILLDTNVVSEPMRPRSDARVLDWLDRQAVETLYLSTVSLAEILTGIEYLPAGRRKDGMARDLEGLLERLLGARVLPFDTKASVACAGVLGRARKSGSAISFADAQIAAVAEVHGMSVATRDGGPFRAVGLRVIDPWDGDGI